MKYLSEGIRHLHIARANGFSPMATLRLWTSYDPTLGDWNVSAWRNKLDRDTSFYSPSKAAKQVIDFRQEEITRNELEAVDFILDLGGYSMLRCITPAIDGVPTGTTAKDIIAGIDRGFFRCDQEIEVMAEVAKLLRDRGLIPTRRWRDIERFPAFDQPEFAEIVKIYTAGRDITAREFRRRVQQAIVNTCSIVDAALGWSLDGMVIAGCANVDTFDGAVAAADCPINHFWAGGDDQDWIEMDMLLSQARIEGRPTWMHLSATAPIETTLAGYALAKKYDNTEAVVLFCDNAISVPEMTPRIEAIRAGLEAA